jgi:hypothetical protein
MRLSSSPLFVALAVVAAWVLLSASARADYISAPAGLGSQGDSGPVEFASDDPRPLDQHKKVDSLTQLSTLLLGFPLTDPSTQAGASGAGGPGGSGTGGSVSPAGLFIRLPVLSLELAGRCDLSYLAYYPPRFAAGVLHPPRSA